MALSPPGAHEAGETPSGGGAAAAAAPRGAPRAPDAGRGGRPAPWGRQKAAGEFAVSTPACRNFKLRGTRSRKSFSRDLITLVFLRWPSASPTPDIQLALCT